MRPLSYYKGRAKLSCLCWLPLSLSALSIGLLLVLYANENITTKSVSVSGYHRSDGTYVGSYSRRPPGSVQHDRPYENIKLLGIVIVGVGGFTAARSVYKFLLPSPFELLPSISSNELVEVPRDVRVPTLRAQARKDWYCESCRAHIGCGSEYWYYKNTYSSRSRICTLCKEALKRSKADLPSARLRYANELRIIRLKQFSEYYGCCPEEIGIITEPVHRNGTPNIK